MKVYSIQETYYQTGNTGMAIHLEGTIEEITELHRDITALIQKAKFKSMMRGDDSDPFDVGVNRSDWAKWVNEVESQD
jgi:hypothetical protein